jgi:uncharacterized protein YbjT (DUF2867 family)
MTPARAETLLSVGATGSIGVHVLAAALAQGYAVRALVRDAGQARRLPAGVTAVVGDLTRAETLAAAVDGVDAIVFTHGSNGRPPGPEAVDYGAVRNVLLALAGRRARIALMTTIGSTDRKGAHDWKRRGEWLVRASGLPYTVVRPSWFDCNEPDQMQLVMLQGDKPLKGNPSDGQIDRRLLASVLVRSLRSPAALRKTFELHSRTGPEQADYEPVFATLDADAAGSLDGVRDPKNIRLDDQPPHILRDLEAVRAAGRTTGNTDLQG